MKRLFRRGLRTTHLIMFSFLLVILLGSALLSLPISQREGVALSYVDTLFTATSAVCVTGLLTVPALTTFTGFGQAVLLVLIQIGGLGVITVVTGLLLTFYRRLSLRSVHLLQEAFNLNTLGGMVSFLKRVLLFTLVVEAIGALCYLPVFVPDFGWRGVWVSVFTSVSAFCNAGIDIVGDASLIPYLQSPLVTLVTAALIILGGLGFIVLWDIARVLRLPRKKHALRYLTLHSKIVLAATALLLFGGALGFLLFEYQNPQTLADLTFPEKCLAAFFQSVTTRTAGFATLPQEALSTPSVFLSMVLMFVGGSPVGTAGGIKTVTLVILVMTAYSTVKMRQETTLFGRAITREAVRKATAVTGVFAAIVLCSTVALSTVCNAPAGDILFECISAAATVGLSRALTPLLVPAGKWILILTMYLGRIGPITMFIAFRITRRGENAITLPKEEVSVG